MTRQILTAAEQGAAPDRLQLRSSFLLTALPAAGELGRSAGARGLDGRRTSKFGIIEL